MEKTIFDLIGERPNEIIRGNFTSFRGPYQTGGGYDIIVEVGKEEYECGVYSYTGDVEWQGDLPSFSAKAGLEFRRPYEIEGTLCKELGMKSWEMGAFLKDRRVKESQILKQIAPWILERAGFLDKARFSRLSLNTIQIEDRIKRASAIVFEGSAEERFASARKTKSSFPGDIAYKGKVLVYPLGFEYEAQEALNVARVEHLRKPQMAQND